MSDVAWHDVTCDMMRCDEMCKLMRCAADRGAAGVASEASDFRIFKNKAG
jgi:hypothetical protein